MTKIEILFEDQWLVAATKMSGVPVHQTLDKTRAHFQGILEKQLGQKLVLFHRLDADTSGVVLFGKNPEINKAMTDLFRNREIKKTYELVVDGAWPPDLNVVEGYVCESQTKKGRYELSPKGRNTEFSRTTFELLKTWNHSTKPDSMRTHLYAFPETGRTHQIRVHCAGMGFPICGDKFYGKANRQGVPLALHARQLEFEHPITLEKISIQSAIPNSLSYWLS